MASNHEDVLYLVEKRRYRIKRIVKTYVFRTRRAAKEFSDDRNIKSAKFEYSEPRRAEWGPNG